MNETECVKELQSGNMDAFDILFEKYKNEAIRTAYLITGNHASSEDIVQETFILCYQNIKKLHDPAQFKSWLFRILTRTAWRSCSKSKKETPTEDILLSAEKGSFLDSSYEYCMQKETTQTLLQAVDQLNPKQRTVIILYYYNELSLNEIAQILNCFPGTVKSRLHAARKNLKIKLLKMDKERKEVSEECQI